MQDAADLVLAFPPTTVVSELRYTNPTQSDQSYYGEQPRIKLQPYFFLMTGCDRNGREDDAQVSWPGNAGLDHATDEAEKHQQPQTASTSDMLGRSGSQGRSGSWGSRLTALSPSSHGLQQLPSQQQHFWFGLLGVFSLFLAKIFINRVSA